MKTLPATPDAPLIRTDFSNDDLWHQVCARVQEPVGDMKFFANVTPVDDKAFEGLTAEQVLDLLPKDNDHALVILFDHTSVISAAHHLAVVDLSDEPGRVLRVAPADIQSIENNLSIANMDFEEFAENVDAEGVFIPFD